MGCGFVLTGVLVASFVVETGGADEVEPSAETDVCMLEGHVRSNPPEKKHPPYRSQKFPEGERANEVYRWKVHDPKRPQPEVVEPPTPSLQQRPGLTPSDAVVLFDGTQPDADLSAFRFEKPEKGDPTDSWVVRDGYFEVKRSTSNLLTKESFGDVQLHVEWMVPERYDEKFFQSRGNSGIKLMSRYEVQILDSLANPTYADGMAGAIYGQNPPLVNPGLGLGRWQTYDIIFRRPIFGDGDEVLRPATLTVLHNGVLIQDNWHLEGQTRFEKRARYWKHADEEPIQFQEHGDAVRYRNIWVRRLPERPLSVVDSSSCLSD